MHSQTDTHTETSSVHKNDCKAVGFQKKLYMFNNMAVSVKQTVHILVHMSLLLTHTYLQV